MSMLTRTLYTYFTVLTCSNARHTHRGPGCHTCPHVPILNLHNREPKEPPIHALEDGEEEHGGGRVLQHARQRTSEERTDAALLAHLIRVRARARVRASTDAALLAHLCMSRARPVWQASAAQSGRWPRLAEAGRGFGVPQRLA